MAQYIIGSIREGLVKGLNLSSCPDLPLTTDYSTSRLNTSREGIRFLCGTRQGMHLHIRFKWISAWRIKLFG